MFDKILIANRGEIACRVMQTARRLGIRTVAVYSQADAGARHVRLADEAVCVGPPAARESYLATGRILAAAQVTGAQAIHPGYGFLSENAGFAEACEGAGLVFIGPPASAIRAMGSKSAAKALMAAAGVPLTPGYHGDQQAPDFLAAQAEAIGYPVLIKASAGGGGKGMRRVDRAEDFAAALASCQREAASAFGSDQVLVEQYVLQPRHVEIQVFADRHGHCVHLFERDCSVQRRHQKVLEEAPAPGMTAERRAAMGRAAVDAAQAVGYVGAGTVEFIVHPGGSFYFMEMNTRLQVEHPVTEMITGLDLVEWQLRVAAGQPLPLRQDQLAIHGHAIEARVYAEDPDRGFLPSTGRLWHLAPPAASPHVRIDTGVEQGDEITPHYDPMIAKLIVWDESRERALARMRQALADYRILGVSHNLAFLSRLVATTSFATADLDTGLIEREQAALFPAQRPVPVEAWLLAALAELLREPPAPHDAVAQRSPFHARDGWRSMGHARRRIDLRQGEALQSVWATYLGEHLGLADFRLDIEGAGHTRSVVAQAHQGDHGRLVAQLDDRRLQATVLLAGDERTVCVDGRTHVIHCLDPLRAADAGAQDSGHGSLTAPMPGKVIAWSVAPGSTVARGAPLLVIEAMKMEHTLVAPRAGVVRAFHFAPGEQVAEGALLVMFDAQA